MIWRIKYCDRYSDATQFQKTKRLSTKERLYDLSHGGSNGKLMQSVHSRHKQR
ncbi:MAG: hypothetical protein ACR2LR_24615 [Hassallia sp.]